MRPKLENKIEKEHLTEHIVEQQYLGICILYHRFRNCALTKDPLVEMNKLIGLSIRKPSDFFVNFQTKYKFSNNENKIIYSIRNEFKRWLEDNKPTEKLKAAELDKWQIRALKQIKGLFDESVFKFVEEKRKKIIVAKNKNMTKDLKKIIIRTMRTAQKDSEYFNNLRVAFNTYFQQNGYFIKYNKLRETFEKTKEYLSDKGKLVLSDNDKLVNDINLQFHNLKKQKDIGIITIKEARYQLDKLKKQFVVQQNGLANTSERIEQLLTKKQNASFEEIWQIVDQGGKKYNFDENQYIRFYEKIYLLLQNRQIINRYVSDYQKCYGRRWAKQFFIDTFGFESKGKVICQRDAFGLTWICERVEDYAKINFLNGYKRFKTTLGMYRCKTHRILPDLFNIKIINRLGRTNEAMSTTIVHENQHCLWREIYTEEMHQLNAEYQRKQKIEIISSFKETLLKKDLTEEKLLKIIRNYVKERIIQLVKLNRINARNEILAYYKSGRFIDQQKKFQLEKIKRRLVKSSNYNYLAQRQPLIDKIINNLKKRIKKERGKDKINNQLLDKTIKEGIKAGETEYRKKYQGGLNETFINGLISIKRQPGCLDDDLDALNKLDKLYQHNRYKVTILLSFNPNWQLLARRLSEYPSVLNNN